MSLDPEDDDFSPREELPGFERRHPGHVMDDSERSARKRLMKARLGLKEVRGLWAPPAQHAQVKSLADRLTRLRTVTADTPDAALMQDQRVRLAAERLALTVSTSSGLHVRPALQAALKELQAALDARPPSA